MSLKNSEVLLTIGLAGAIATRGKYQAINKLDDQGKKVFIIERNPDGGMEKTEALRLKTLQLPSNHDSSLNTKLGSDFVNFAISDDGRPKSVSAGVWSKMTDMVKLNFHVRKYAEDLHPGQKFSYTVISEEDDEA